MPILPTFIIPGAAKAGTTTLYHYLRKHPEIFMSKIKEPNVFMNRRGEPMDIRHYEGMFDEYAGEKTVGEASVNYMVKPESAELIYEHIPDVKLIFSLRDPIKRAISHYWSRTNSRLSMGSMAEVIGQGRDAFPIYYGLYSTHIQRFLEFFPRENIHVNILEEMNQDWDRTFERIFKFLGVSVDFKVEREENKNVAKRRRFFIIHKIIKDLRRGHKYKGIFPRTIRDVGKEITGKIMEWNTESFKAPPVDPDIERRLAEFFIPEIEELEKFLGREIPSWGTKRVLQLA